MTPLHLSDDQEIIARLLQQNNLAFEVLYKFYFPVVEKLILKNNGSSEDAKDIFQETVLILLNNLHKNDFVLTASLRTYLYSISRHLWLKRLREIKKSNYTDLSGLEEDVFSEDCFETEPEKTPAEKIKYFLSRITEPCQRLLKAIFFLGKTIETVRTEFGYTTLHNAQNQKYKCLQQIRKLPADS